MKAYIIALVGLVFIVFFRQNPLGAMIFLGIIGGIYFLYKSRGRMRRSLGSGLFGGRGYVEEDENFKVLTFLVLSKFLSNSSEIENKNANSYIPVDQNKDVNFHEKAKNEILRIFEV